MKRPVLRGLRRQPVLQLGLRLAVLRCGLRLRRGPGLGITFEIVFVESMISFEAGGMYLFPRTNHS